MTLRKPGNREKAAKNPYRPNRNQNKKKRRTSSRKMTICDSNRPRLTTDRAVETRVKMTVTRKMTAAHGLWLVTGIEIKRMRNYAVGHIFTWDRWNESYSTATDKIKMRMILMTVQSQLLKDKGSMHSWLQSLLRTHCRNVHCLHLKAPAVKKRHKISHHSKRRTLRKAARALRPWVN